MMWMFLKDTEQMMFLKDTEPMFVISFAILVIIGVWRLFLHNHYRKTQVQVTVNKFIYGAPKLRTGPFNFVLHPCCSKIMKILRTRSKMYENVENVCGGITLHVRAQSMVLTIKNCRERVCISFLGPILSNYSGGFFVCFDGWKQWLVLFTIPPVHYIEN